MGLPDYNKMLNIFRSIIEMIKFWPPLIEYIDLQRIASEHLTV